MKIEREKEMFTDLSSAAIMQPLRPARPHLLIGETRCTRFSH